MWTKRSSMSIPGPIWALGIATFLMNASSVIVFSISSFSLNAHGIHTGLIGFLEGAVEACSYFMKLFSGVISDYMQKRKKLMIIGFLLAIIARPILAMAQGLKDVYLLITASFMGRICDRVGNGLQSTPRDALVADLAPTNIRGACYGLRQTLAMAGSFLGGILAMVAMELTNENFGLVFVVALIPAILGFIILLMFVKEPKKHHRLFENVHGTSLEDKLPNDKPKPMNPLAFKELKRLPKCFWVLMGIAFVFMLSRVGEAMLILHAVNNYNLRGAYGALVLIIYNGANAVMSYPIGYLSDRMPRAYLLLLGFLSLVISDLFLALSPNFTGIIVGIAFWGFQIGITQSMFLALITDKVPADLRGTGVGFFYFITAIALVIAGTVGGNIAHSFNEATMFLVSAIVGIVASIMLLIDILYNKRKQRMHSVH